MSSALSRFQKLRFTEFNIRVNLKTSQMRHSCSPNCRTASGPAPDYKMRVTTAVPISKGQEITSYVLDSYHFESTMHRQAYLNENGFTCRCKRCLDPTELGTFLSGIKCFNCSSRLTANMDDAENSVGFLVFANPLDSVSRSEDLKYKCHRCQFKCLESKIKKVLPMSVWNVIKNILTLTMNKSNMDPKILAKSLETHLTNYEENPDANRHLHRNYWIIQNGMRKLIKIQMDNLDEMTEPELDRLVRRLQFLLTIDEKFFPGPRLSQKYEDWVNLTKALNFMIRFSKFAHPRMPKDKFVKLTRIFIKTDKERLEFLILESFSEEAKLDAEAKLKLLLKAEKHFEGLYG